MSESVLVTKPTDVEKSVFAQNMVCASATTTFDRNVNKGKFPRISESCDVKHFHSITHTQRRHLHWPQIETEREIEFKL